MFIGVRVGADNTTDSPAIESKCSAPTPNPRCCSDSSPHGAGPPDARLRVLVHAFAHAHAPKRRRYQMTLGGLCRRTHVPCMRVHAHACARAFAAEDVASPKQRRGLVWAPSLRVRCTRACTRTFCSGRLSSFPHSPVFTCAKVREACLPALSRDVVRRCVAPSVGDQGD